MMVDTINPNTSQPDEFAGATSQTPATPATEPPVVPAGGDHFYGGFDRPDEVKINLADGGGSASDSVPQQQAQPAATQVPEPQPMPVTPVTPEPTPAVAANTAPVFTDTVSAAPSPSVSQAETQVHSSYASKNALNVRGLLVLGAAFVVLTLIGGVGAYFIAGAIGSGNEKKLQDQLTSLNQQLSDLKQQPTALSVPATQPETTTPTTTAPTTDTTTTPSTTTTTPETTPPIESTQTTVPTTNTDQSKTAAG